MAGLLRPMAFESLCATEMKPCKCAPRFRRAFMPFGVQRSARRNGFQKPWGAAAFRPYLPSYRSNFNPLNRLPRLVVASPSFS